MASYPILFVNPDKADCALWVKRLSFVSSDYHITTTHNGRDALSVCRSRKFDCVVLELVLPDISGFEVLAHLCPLASQRAAAVVILTKLVFATMPMLTNTGGAQAYLIKPRTSANQLDVAIQNAIASMDLASQESSR